MTIIGFSCQCSTWSPRPGRNLPCNGSRHVWPRKWYVDFQKHVRRSRKWPIETLQSSAYRSKCTRRTLLCSHRNKKHVLSTWSKTEARNQMDKQESKKDKKEICFMLFLSKIVRFYWLSLLKIQWIPIKLSKFQYGWK